ncbi:Hypothetical predicted protein [Mytilus galloprovincialis]|uniref:ATP-dependent DNA helicase n=1 Tax=Mytilus galloprovincialis TaxID=29158 RepID=A0A8B6EAG4_MYTGA|nr:Hypothetical predicted protein [Mytilus galloprovincialis]
MPTGTSKWTLSDIPPEVEITMIGKQLVALRIPFMKISLFTKGGQWILPDGSKVLDIVNYNRERYETDPEELEKAWEDLQQGNIQQDAWAQIAPEAEAERLEIEMEKPVKIPEENEDQSLTHLKWCIDVTLNKEPEPFHLFLTGGAGTGKTHLVRCIYHEANIILSKTACTPDATSVILTAPTGMAAFKIEGSTIHSAFALKKAINLPYQPLGESLVNSLRAKYESVRIHVLFIDEISMVDHKLLSYIHGRLSQIKQTKTYFGNIATCFELYQLPPADLPPFIETSSVFLIWSCLKYPDKSCDKRDTFALY